MDWKFLGRFLLYLSLFFSAGQAPLELLQDAKIATAAVVAGFWKALGVPVALAGVDVRFFEFPMVITLECTALHYLAIFSAGVLADRRKTYGYRLAGIILGAAAIFALNVLRIGILGLVGHYAEHAFEFVHAYLWQGTFALLVLLLWIVWSEGRAAVAGIPVRAAVRAFLGATCAYVAATLLMEQYASLLAPAADVLFSLLARAGGPEIAAVTDGGMVGYVFRQDVIYNKVASTVLNAVIFCALASGSSAGRSPAVLLQRVAAGAGLLFMQHLGYVVMYGLMLERGIDPELFAMALWVTVGVSMITPVLIWIAVSLLFRPAQGSKQDDREGSTE